MLPMVGTPSANGFMFYLENLLIIGGYVFLAIVYGIGRNVLTRSVFRWEPPVAPGVEFYRVRRFMRWLRMNQVRIAGFFFCFFGVFAHVLLGVHAAVGVALIVNGGVPWYMHAVYIPKGICLWVFVTGITRPRKYKDPNTSKAEIEDSEIRGRLNELEQERKLWRDEEPPKKKPKT